MELIGIVDMFLGPPKRASMFMETPFRIRVLVIADEDLLYSEL